MTAIAQTVTHRGGEGKKLATTAAPGYGLAMWRVALAIMAAGGAGGFGCGRAPAQYHFANPMIASMDVPVGQQPQDNPIPTRQQNAITQDKRAAPTDAPRSVRAPGIRDVSATSGPSTNGATGSSEAIAGVAQGGNNQTREQPQANDDQRQTMGTTSPRDVMAKLPVESAEQSKTWTDLRVLVGTQSKLQPVTQLGQWRKLVDSGELVKPDATIAEFVEHQREANRVTTAASPGDAVVFDRVVDNEPSTLVGLVLATDSRGVSEFIYLAAGVVRRGFVDPQRPKLHRDSEGLIVNTFLRHNRNWPPPGTRFLAGELFATFVDL